MANARTPVQQRSRDTHDALLDAAEDLGNSKTYDQLTVQEIAAHAGYTIGAFYARFPSKASLLEALTERYESMVDDASSRISSLEPGEDVVERLTDAFVAAYQRNAGRLRLLESARQTVPELSTRVAALRTTILGFAIDALRAKYPLPQEDLETATLLLIVPLRELYFKQEFWPNNPSRLKSQTTRLASAVRTFLETKAATLTSSKSRRRSF